MTSKIRPCIAASLNFLSIRFDDSSVHPTSVNNVLNTSAYVIFYEMTRESRDKYLQKTAATSSSKKSDTVIGTQLEYVVVYHVTIVAMNCWKKFWPTHCRKFPYLKLCRPAHFVRITQLLPMYVTLVRW